MILILFSHQILSLQFLKRINIVEDIINQFNNGLKNPEYDKLTATVYSGHKLLTINTSHVFKPENNTNCEICTQIKDLKEDGFVLHTLKDIENVVFFLKILIRDKVLPYFEMNNDLNLVREKQKEQISKFNSTVPIIPLMHSLVLMKLTNDSDFEILKEKYKKILVPLHGFEGESENVLQELVRYLEKKEF